MQGRDNFVWAVDGERIANRPREAGGFSEADQAVML
jgi:hypothetical protein